MESKNEDNKLEKKIRNFLDKSEIPKNFSIKKENWHQTQNSFLVSGSYDKSIKILNLCSGNVQEALDNNNEEVLCLLKISNSEFASSSDKNIKIWSLNSMKIWDPKILLGHSDRVFCLSVLDRDKKNFIIISGSFDSTIKLWNINDSSCIRTLMGHTDVIWHVVSQKTSQIISASGDLDRSIRIWYINSRYESVKNQVLVQHRRSILCLVLLLNGFLGLLIIFL